MNIAVNNQESKVCIFMQNYASSLMAKLTVAHLAKLGFKYTKLVEYFSASPDINTVENLWTVIKRNA